MSARALPPLVIVSGMSGSGKSGALHTLEDLGYYCVDNLPADLLPEFVRRLQASESSPDKVAVGIDARNLDNLSDVPVALSQIGAMGANPRLLFLEARDDVLLRRYADTRRRHPLSHLGLVLADAISLERQALKPLRQIADHVLDTSELNVHQMRRHILTNTASVAPACPCCSSRSPIVAACRPSPISCSMRGCCPTRIGMRGCGRCRGAMAQSPTTSTPIPMSSPMSPRCRDSWTPGCRNCARKPAAT